MYKKFKYIDQEKNIIFDSDGQMTAFLGDDDNWYNDAGNRLDIFRLTEKFVKELIPLEMDTAQQDSLL